MSYKRKLEALGYEGIDEFNVFSEEQFRTLVVFLEDQVIRHYAIEDRAPLRKITSPEWEGAFKAYCDAILCPFTDREEVTDWLLGLAIRLEYGDNVEQYRNITAENINLANSNVPQVSKAIAIRTHACFTEIDVSICMVS